MRNYVFGYGSLVGPSGINGRGMRKFYRNKDLTETYLHGYERHLLAGNPMSEINYYGVNESKGSKINGVVFEINDQDIPAFKISEGFGFSPECQPYKMVDVTSKIDLKLAGRVWTCVSLHRFDGKVTNYYKIKVDEALSSRSKQFKKEFTPYLKPKKFKYVDFESGLPWGD